MYRYESFYFISNKISFLFTGLHFAINPTKYHVYVLYYLKMVKLAETFWTTNFRCELTCYSQYSLCQMLCMQLLVHPTVLDMQGPVTMCHRMTAVPPSVVSHTVFMSCKLITIVNSKYKWEQSIKHNQINTLEFNFTETTVLTQL